MKKRVSVLIITWFCFLLFLGALAGLRQDRLVAPIAGQILRFRVLAAGDSPEEQAEKLAVRDAVLALLADELPEQADRAQICSYISEHTPALLSAAKAILPEDTTVSLALTDAYFPTRTYGSLTFPRGTYRALMIRIGEARGENWWCCLYPQLCFTDAVTAVVNEESEHQLRQVLTDDEYHLLEGEKEVKFRFLEWLEEIFRG